MAEHDRLTNSRIFRYPFSTDASVAHVPAQYQDGFRADLLLAHETNRARVIPKTRTGKQNTWLVWCAFCEALEVDCYLTGVPDKLDYFIVFGLRYRRGELSKSGNPVRVGSVTTALQAVGERFTELGLPDPRLQPGTNSLMPRLRGVITFMRNEDPAASRVWPVCLTILEALIEQTRAARLGPYGDALVDMCIIGFYFLCRPGEHAISDPKDQGRSSPFCLEHVSFSRPTRRYQAAASCDLNDVQQATFVTLCFTDQKNAVKGEHIGHGQSSHPVLCPVEALKRRVLHLRAHGADPTQALHSYYIKPGASPSFIDTKQIGMHLRKAAKSVQHITGIPPERIQARSLRSGGATALLVAGTDEPQLKTFGRWQSDAMLRCLRSQAQELTSGHAAKMLNHGRYSFSASTSYGDKLHASRDLVPQEAPEILHRASRPLALDVDLSGD